MLAWPCAAESECTRTGVTPPDKVSRCASCKGRRSSNLQGGYLGKMVLGISGFNQRMSIVC